MARFRGVAVCVLVVGIFGCGPQHIEPAPTAPVPKTVAPTPTAQASAPPPTPTAQASAPPPTPTAQAPTPGASASTNAPPSASPLWAPPPDITRWRTAVENYVPAASPKNTGRLGDSMRPFAYYVNQVHARIHPIFSDQFLTSLDRLPSSDPMNRPDLRVKLEIILEAHEGRIHRVGVVVSSGSTAFDVMTLESVHRAQPFGPPPREIVSPDGFVYLHWEFHRGPEACGSWNAHPFLLSTAPNAARTP